jgi:hypothetical protein
MGSAVIDTFAGILRRDGVDLNCRVMARRVERPGTGTYEHVNWSIASVDGEASDGNYDLLANGKVIPLKRQNGHWLAR